MVWASTGQTGVASSSCEAEYAAISDCVRRVCELRNFMASIGRKAARPTILRTDAHSAINTLHGPVIAQRLRHIDIRMHRTRQAINDGDIEIVKVPTEISRADGFTKVLPRSTFEKFFHHELMSAINTSTTSPSTPTTPRRHRLAAPAARARFTLSFTLRLLASYTAFRLVLANHTEGHGYARCTYDVDARQPSMPRSALLTPRKREGAAPVGIV